MDLFQIQIHILDVKFNPFNWICITYRLDFENPISKVNLCHFKLENDRSGPE